MILAALWAYILAASFGLSLLLTPLCERASHRFGILDRPGIRKIHGAPMPLLGGAAVFLSFTAIVVLHTALGGILAASATLQALVPDELVRRVAHLDAVLPRLAVLFLGGVLVFAIGLADDARGLSARRRFVLELAIAGLVVVLGIRPDYPDVPSWLLVTAAVIWVTGVTNALNLLDSMDGLAGGVAAIAAAGLALLVGLRNQPLVVALLLAVVGSIGGVLRFNLYPARVFLGSSGTMFAGYTLAVACLFATFLEDGQPGFVSVAAPLLVLALPLFDMMAVVLRRVAAGRSPFRADRLHVAHQLLRLGLTQRQGTALLHLVSLHGVVSAILVAMASPGLRGLILVQAGIPYGVLLLLMRRRRHRAEERISLPWTGSVALEGADGGGADDEAADGGGADDEAADGGGGVGEGAVGERRIAGAGPNEVRLVDVAPRGIGVTIETEEESWALSPQDPPRRLAVCLQGPGGTIRFRGRARWSRPIEVGLTRVGIEIEQMDPEDRGRFEALLRRLAED